MFWCHLLYSILLNNHSSRPRNYTVQGVRIAQSLCNLTQFLQKKINSQTCETNTKMMSRDSMVGGKSDYALKMGNKVQIAITNFLKK